VEGGDEMQPFIAHFMEELPIMDPEPNRIVQYDAASQVLVDENGEPIYDYQARVCDECFSHYGYCYYDSGTRMFTSLGSYCLNDSMCADSDRVTDYDELCDYGCV
jgi:hypothetical protein